MYFNFNCSCVITSYSIHYTKLYDHIQNLSEQNQFEIEVVGNVLPFKVNNYVIERLIDWKNIPTDPMFVLTFPQKDMLKPEHFEKMSNALKNGSDKKEIAQVANEIRLQLNPRITSYNVCYTKLLRFS